MILDSQIGFAPSWWVCRICYALKQLVHLFTFKPVLTNIEYGLASICVLVAQSCPALSKSMDLSLPGASVHGTHQARTLNWVAIAFSRGFSQPRDWTLVFHMAGRFSTVWASREAWPGEQVILWVKHASVCVGFLQYLKTVSIRKVWENNTCYRPAVGCHKERALQDHQTPTQQVTPTFENPQWCQPWVMIPCASTPSSHCDEGAVKRQAVQVRWESGRRALGPPVLPTEDTGWRLSAIGLSCWVGMTHTSCRLLGIFLVRAMWQSM